MMIFDIAILQYAPSWPPTPSRQPMLWQQIAPSYQLMHAETLEFRWRYSDFLMRADDCGDNAPAFGGSTLSTQWLDRREGRIAAAFPPSPVLNAAPQKMKSAAVRLATFTPTSL